MQLTNTNKYHSIEQAIWLFVLILLFEGVLRKWILPSANFIFLVARDPIALYVVFQGFKYNLLKNKYAIMMLLLGMVAFFTTLWFGHQNLLVAVYGSRIMILYFPFMYICAQVITRRQILLIGKFLVILLTPNVLITILQFFAPQSAWINVDPGGGEGTALYGAMGVFRPRGIFTGGQQFFYAITFSFLLYFLSNKQVAKEVNLKKWVLILAVIAYVISLPVSISRTHIVQSAMILFICLFVTFRNRKLRTPIIMMILLFVVIAFWAYINKNSVLFLQVFFARFDGANESEGGLATSALNRTFGWLMRALNHDVPFWGYGTGLFTNIGIQVVFGGRWEAQQMAVADAVEMEWGRIVCESGILLGGMIIITRFGMAWQLFRLSLKKLKSQDPLMWFLMPCPMLFLFHAQLKTSYILGFTALAVFLCLGAYKQK